MQIYTRKRNDLKINIFFSDYGLDLDLQRKWRCKHWKNWIFYAYKKYSKVRGGLLCTIENKILRGKPKKIIKTKWSI